MMNKIGRAIIIMIVVFLLFGIVVSLILATSQRDENYDVIKIIKAEHFDSRGKFISDIYQNVKELDGRWSKPILDGDYIRIKFEQNLTSKKDITVYPRILSGNPKIEIYEINRNEKIAEFTNLKENKYNKVYLTNLQGEQDTFDLRVVGGSLEFEHIIDPTLTSLKNASTDINLAPIDNETFVIAYINNSNQASNVIEFIVMNTNGTVKAGPVTVANSQVNVTASRVAVTAINSTAFAIGFLNGTVDNRAIYLTTGTKLVGPFSGDAAIGNGLYDIGLSGNGIGFVYCYVDNVEADADMFIYLNNLSNVGGEGTFNTAMAPATNLTNIIDCASMNKQNGTVFEYDATSPGDLDATFHMFQNATETVADTDIDTSVNGNAGVTATSLNENSTVMAWYNSTRLFIAIRSKDNVALLAATQISSVSVAETVSPKLAITTVNNGTGTTSTRDFFVLAWYNQSQDQLVAAAFDDLGNYITTPFVVDSAYNNGTLTSLFDVLGEEDAAGITLCPGKWIIAYTNKTNSTIVKTYDLAGADWSGNCTVGGVADTTVPQVLLINPPNRSSILTSVAVNNTFFNAHFTDNINVSNATLYIYNSTGTLVGTNFTNLGNASMSKNISFNLNESGNYSWNFLALDNATTPNQAFNESNFTLKFGRTLNSSLAQFLSISVVLKPFIIFPSKSTASLITSAVISRTAGLFRTPIGLITINSAVAKIRFFLSNIVQPTQIFDKINNIFGTLRFLTANNIITTSLARTRLVLTSLSQNLIISNSLSRILLAFRNLAERVSINGILSALRNVRTNLVQSLNINSILTRIGLFNRGLVQNLIITDSLSRIGFFFRALTERVLIVTSPTTTKIISVTSTLVNLVQNLIITPVLKTVALFNRGLSQSLVINAIIAKTKFALASLVQQMNIAVSLVRTLFGIRTATGDVIITSVVSERINFVRGLTQNTLLNAILSRTAFLRATIVQPININSILSRIYLGIRNPAQLLEINTVLDRIRLVPRNIVQSLNIFSVVNRVGLFSRSLIGNVIINAKLTTTAVARNLVDLVQNLIITPVLKTVALFNRGLSANTLINTIISRTRLVLTSLTQNLAIRDVFAKTGLFIRIIVQPILINAKLTTTAVARNLVDLVQNLIITPVTKTIGLFKRGLSTQVAINAVVSRTRFVITSLVQRINIATNLVRTLLGIRTQTGNVIITTSLSRTGIFTRAIYQPFNIFTRGIVPVKIFLVNLYGVLDIDSIFDKRGFFFRLIEALLRIITGRVGPAEAEPTPTPTPAPSGGAGESVGGGGGGGGGIIRTSAVPNIIIEPSALSISVVSGIEEIRKIKVVNLDNRGVVLNVEIAGKGLENVLSLDRSITLKPGEEKLIDLKINSSSKESLTGKIIFKSGNYANEVLVVINTRSANFLFDVSIDIPDKFTRLDSGEKLFAQINLLQIGHQGRVNLTANYIIKDFLGNVYLEESETFYVTGQKEYLKEFSTLDLPPGKYIVGLEIIYPGAFATSSSQFEIKKKVINNNLFIIIFIGIILILILALAFVLFTKIYSAKKRRLILNLIKEKYKIKENFIKLPKIL